MSKSGSGVRSSRRMSSWVIVASGFVAYLGLVFGLAVAEIRLELPLPWWAAQLTAPLLGAALVFAIARPRSASSLIGGAVLLWAAELLVGVLTEAFLNAFSGVAAAPSFPPPVFPALFGAALLLAPLRDHFTRGASPRRARPAAERRTPERSPAPERSQGTERRVPSTPAAAAARPAGPRPMSVTPKRPVEPSPVAAVEEPSNEPSVAVAAEPMAAEPSEPLPSAPPPASTASLDAPEATPPPVAEPPADAPGLGELLTRDASEEPLAISFARIASQLPDGLCAAPLDQVAAEMERPGHLLVPRRLALSQLALGMVRAPWDVVAGQFPRHLLLMGTTEVAARLPEGQLLLPIDEVVRQFPAALFMPAGPAPDIRGIESFPEPFQPMAAAAQSLDAEEDTSALAEADSPAPDGLVDTSEIAAAARISEAQDDVGWTSELPETVAGAIVEPAGTADEPTGEMLRTMEEPIASTMDEPIVEAFDGLAPESPVSGPTAAEEWDTDPLAPSVESADPMDSPQTSPPPIRQASAWDAIAAARALAGGLARLGSFEIGVRTAEGMDLFSASRAGLDEDVAIAARVLLPLLVRGCAPWPIDQVTLRGARGAVVLTPVGPVQAESPVLATAVRGGGALALLELRSRAAAGASLGAAVDAASEAVSADEREESELLDVEPPTRVHQVAASLGALGHVAARALRDAEAGHALYLFLPPESDGRAIGAFADQVVRALLGPDANELEARTIVLRSGARRMIVRLPATGATCGDTIVAAGETASPGLLYRQVEEAAAALGAS